MASVDVRELSQHTSRYLARVKAGQSIEVTEHGRVIAVITPAGGPEAHARPRPRVGGFRSVRPLSAEEVDAGLADGLGDSDRR